MALIKCKNCGREISDKAQVCPGCGKPVVNDVFQEVKKDETQSVKKKKTHMFLIGIVILFGVLALIIALGTRKTQKPVENNTGEETSLQNEVEDTDKTGTKDENIEVSWEDGVAPTEVGGEGSIAKILETKVVNSSHGTLLVMSFEYTNNSSEAEQFGNDMNCDITPYQNGIALDSPGFTSEEGVYDSSDAYSAVKSGGVINTQLAWVLHDNVSPIEIEFGNDDSYNPDFIKTILLSGGTKTEEENIEKETTKSDYKITWNSEVPEKIGNEAEQAFIKNVAVVDSGSHGRVLVIDIDFINNLESGRDLINDTACNISVYQNGVMLDTPGITSDGEYFNYSDAFTLVKKGGKISTQLVWSLEDESVVEIEFGLDENYNAQYIASFTFEK